MSLSQGRERYKDRKRAQVYVIDDVSSCEKLLECFQSRYAFEMNYIGIDCEWVNKEGQVNAPVALLQIATPLCDCFLVRLCKMDGQMPQTVKEILEDKAILKFGVGIQDDAKRLSKMFDIHVQGCVDLRHIITQRTQLDNGNQSCQKMSLDALAKKILGITLNKSWKIRCSNWEDEKLSPQQIEYAMNDALVASHIFLRGCSEDEGTNQSCSITSECHPDNNGTGVILKQSGKNLGFCLPGQEATACYHEHHDSPTSQFAENRNLNQEDKNQENVNDTVKGDCDLSSDSQICDKRFQDLASGADYYETTLELGKFESDEMEGYLSRDEAINLISLPGCTERAASLCNGVIDVAFKGRKREASSNDQDSDSFCPERSCKPSQNGTRESPLYVNCILTDLDGLKLCSLDRKKADWYIAKGKGQLKNVAPYTVQLNVEPRGRPGTEDYYYQNCKVNQCVVCGKNDSYMKKSVIPHEYRHHFPAVMKDHHSHDILLTCPQCHRSANSHDNQLKKELAIKYNAPLGNPKDDPELKKVKSAARALDKPGNKLPEEKRQEFSRIVQEHFSASALTPEMISQAATMETHNFVSHGFVVVERVRQEGKLLEFEKMWRERFLRKMQPQFLPPLWSVDHRHEILKEKWRDCQDHLY